MLREAFYYLLGGVTFLPLCILGAFLHFYFNAPSTRQNGPPSIEADVELTHEKKLAALDLAARNAALHAEIENAKGKDHPQGDATAPSTAKRLGSGPAKDSSVPKPFSSGWLTVRPTFDSDKDNANAANGSNSPAAIPASLIEGESDSSQLHSEDEGAAPDSKAPATPANAGAGYMSQMYRGILDYRIGKKNAKKPANDISNARSAPTSTGTTATPTGTAGKENFFCILKSPILYLYSSDDTANPNTECHAAIDLRGKRVSIFVAGLGDTLGDLDPEQPASTQHGGTTTDNEQLADGAVDQQGFNAKQAWKKAKRALVRDGELFMKRNAIRIVGSASERKKGRTTHLGRRRPQWFIFCKNNFVMEDWYHALLQASLLSDSSLSTKLPDDGAADLLSRLFGKLGDPIGPTFSQEDMASLLVSLDSLPDPLPLRWLNALVGRIFFSIYRTAWLEDYIISKMMKKINRVKTPGFLGDIKVEEVDVGRRAPGFSRPMLKALTSEGEASMEVAVHYVGEIRIMISTTLTLSLGARFKPYNIPIVLAVVLRSLEGNLLLHVKRPPSSRLWFGFTTMPKMEIDIEPVVSARKVQWGMVTRLIEGRLKELLNESIVVPNMDDISFFDTRSLPLRGGIFADAAKKSDVLQAEVKEPSDPAAAATTTTATQQERDAKPKTSSIKISDLLAANKVGAVSAPVSGAATPVTDGASASTPRDARADEDGETSSVKTSASSTQALRNRKTGAEPSSISLKEPSSSTARTSSPAAAGLSDLLSRDLAAGGGSTLSGSPPRQDSQSAKRRTWFGSGPKSSVSSVASASGLSSLGLGAASRREQSSLALGNASIERPSQRSHSASVSGRSESVLSVPTSEGSIRAVSDSASISTGISPVRSPSILSTADDVKAEERTTSDALTEMQRTGSQETKPVKSGSTSGNPSFIVSSALEPLLALDTDAVKPVDPAREKRTTLEAPSVHDGDDERDFVESPASLTHSTKSSLRGSRSDVAHLQNAKKMFDDGSELARTESTEGSAISDFAPASRTSSRSSEAGDATSAQRSMAPPPPPPRRPNEAPRETRSVPRQDAASALSSVQRSRYGLNESAHGAEEGADAMAGSTSAMLLTSWNKAKASMADKEARQAAARDAKDAIKRGWANWNSKRAEAKQRPPEYEETDSRQSRDSMTQSQSSRLSLIPGKSAWLASSPPDPTSFGLGFDKASPEDTLNTLRDKHGSAGYYARNNLTDTDDDNVSIYSNSSNRQPYRELRASKVHGFDGALTDRTPESDRGPSVSSLKLASTASLADTRSNSSTSVGDSQWDAEIPYLTPPAPAFHEKEGGAESKRRGIERTSSNETSPAAIIPPALPQRRPSSSVSSTGQSGVGGIVSFIPPAPSATTTLASTSSLSAQEIEPVKQDDAQNEQPASYAVDGESTLAAETSAVLPEPRTPKRRVDGGENKVSSSDVKVQKASQDVFDKLDQALPDKQAAAKPGEAADAVSAPTEASSLATNETPEAKPETSQADDAAAAKTPSKTERSYSPIPPELSSPSLGSGIKKQPGRATMMAVPGIPSMQKAGPQSFSAPPPPASQPMSVAETSPASAFRASSLFKIPSFGSPILAGGAAMKGGGSKQGEGATMPPLVPARPGAEAKGGDEGSALGLSQMHRRASTGVKAYESASKSIGCSAVEQPLTDDKTADAGDRTTFAEVAEAEGPAEDPEFEQAQLDAGETFQVGSKELKLPSATQTAAKTESQEG